jgi:hypothetical protein
MAEIDKKQIWDIVKEYMQTQAFSDRKLTDTPTDNLSVVNRRYVTLNGALTSRPVSSVATVGQRYFDTTNNVPIWYTTAGWRNSVGSIVALNN